MPKHYKHNGDMDHMKKWNQDETMNICYNCYTRSNSEHDARKLDKSILLDRQILYADLIVKIKRKFREANNIVGS
jgi:hypothetical protein